MPMMPTAARFAAAAAIVVSLPIAAAIVGAQVPGPPQGAATQAPDPNIPLYFEVAAIKPNNSGERGGSIRRSAGGRMTATNMPVRALIMFAYQVTPLTLVSGPEWTRQENFDIVAKMEGDPAPVAPGSGPDHMMLAMRTLLADRFKLKVHRETREMDAYALVMAKSGGAPGLKLKPSTQDCSPETMRAMIARGTPPPPPPAGSLVPFQCGARTSPGRFQVGGMPLSTLLGPLGGITGRSVVDRTGLTGAWDLELLFAPDPGRGTPPPDAPPADPDAPSLFTALQEQLGLKLESTKAPIEVLVIDSIEHPTPD
jgi:uncharacterized protein (TIGR03435 family)